MPGQTILIIDDDATFCANLTGVLKEAGYRPIEAHDGPSALAAIEELGSGIDLMIVDLSLPDNVNGIDIIVTAARRSMPVKIIAASAVFDQVYLDMATGLGADAAIRKSLDGAVASEWLEVVRRLLGESDSDPAPSHRLVVLVDDENSVRGFVKSILQRAGYQVLEAADGAAGLAIIQKIRGVFDLLITDFVMPNLDGPGLVRAMRAEYPGIPVVYMSGYTDEQDLEYSEAHAKNCAFVKKPFLSKQFLEVVRGMMLN